MNIIILISTHSRIEFLDFCLEHYFKFFNINEDNIVISTANKELHFDKEKSIKHLVIHDEDHGYMGGCQYNIIKGIDYINNNLDYDYIAVVEPDNIFYSYDKFLMIINDMEKYKKHFLVDKQLIQPEKDNDIFLGTINIFSNFFIKNHFPFEIYNEFFKIPYENYMGSALRLRNNINSKDEMLNFYSNVGYLLDYDDEIIYFEKDPIYYHPARFVKYGIINAFDNNFENFCKFLERHKEN